MSRTDAVSVTLEAFGPLLVGSAGSEVSQNRESLTQSSKYVRLHKISREKMSLAARRNSNEVDGLVRLPGLSKADYLVDAHGSQSSDIDDSYIEVRETC